MLSKPAQALVELKGHSVSIITFCPGEPRGWMLQPRCCGKDPEWLVRLSWNQGSQLHCGGGWRAAALCCSVVSQKLSPVACPSFCISFHQPSRNVKLKVKVRTFMLLTLMYCNMDREITAHRVMIRAVQYQSVVVPALLKGRVEISTKTLTS